MDNLKPFDPRNLDASLIRVVSFSGKRYALFPFIDATGTLPEFRSVRMPLQQSELTAHDLGELAALAARRGENGRWFIQFSTPWLVAKTTTDSPTAPIEKRNR